MKTTARVSIFAKAVILCALFWFSSACASDNHQVELQAGSSTASAHEAHDSVSQDNSNQAGAAGSAQSSNPISTTQPLTPSNTSEPIASSPTSPPRADAAAPIAATPQTVSSTNPSANTSTPSPTQTPPSATAPATGTAVTTETPPKAAEATITPARTQVSSSTFQPETCSVQPGPADEPILWCNENMCNPDSPTQGCPSASDPVPGCITGLNSLNEPGWLCEPSCTQEGRFYSCPLTTNRNASPTPTPIPPVATDPSLAPPFDVSAFIGLDEIAATSLAQSIGRPSRVVRIDNEWFPTTMDYIQDRLNFEIDNGVVTAVTLG